MTPFDRLHDLARERTIIGTAASTLGWDQETYMPPQGASHRAAQLAWLSARGHELATSTTWKHALRDALAEDSGHDPRKTANLREMERLLKRAEALPVELVSRATHASSMAKHAWADARRRSDFSTFAPHLQTLLDIAREKAEHWGYASEPYDALLEDYERGTSTAEVAALFDAIRPDLQTIAHEAIECTSSRPVTLPAGPYPIARQQSLNQLIAEAVGFDFEAGRIDTTTHPFCTTLGPRDVRLTTRYDEEDFTSSLFGVLHEAGHGLYEQGLNPDELGLPGGDAASLGIHESQSRLWENHVGRSRSFWNHWWPVALEHFPQLEAINLDEFLDYLNRAARSFIRVEADETTYDLHIILRFQLERQLLRGELAVKDVPAIWNEEFHKSFGMTPPDDTHGCLQDIHWSMGGLGYFPTYTLGNIHSAQLFAAAQKDNDIRTATSRADYQPLLQWLRTNIHSYGATRTSAELITGATGKKPSATAYLAHLRNRGV